MFWLILLACTDAAVDDSAVVDTNPSECEEAPTVVYSNFGEGFITENCQSCHASTTLERYGAPESVTFDTSDEVWAWAERILIRSTGDTPSMPPNGGPSEADRTRLYWWLTCAAPGT